MRDALLLVARRKGRARLHVVEKLNYKDTQTHNIVNKDTKEKKGKCV
jgi:hypothetical protein